MVTKECTHGYLEWVEGLKLKHTNVPDELSTWERPFLTNMHSPRLMFFYFYFYAATSMLLLVKAIEASVPIGNIAF